MRDCRLPYAANRSPKSAASYTIDPSRMRLQLAASLLLIAAGAAATAAMRPHSALKVHPSASRSDDASDTKPAAKIVSGPKLIYVSSQHAVVEWVTDVPSSSVLRYGTSESDLDKTERASRITKVHRVALSKLKNDTTYHYQVSSNVGKGKPAVSSIEQFTTAKRGARPQHFEQR